MITRAIPIITNVRSAVEIAVYFIEDNKKTFYNCSSSNNLKSLRRITQDDYILNFFIDMSILLQIHRNSSRK